MIELYELRQFAAFANAGTLSEAAEILHLSQPALSRNMKKPEDDLGVTLFVRKKNRLELNGNGEYVLGLTQQLLEDADSLAVKAREFDRRNRTIVLGVCAPAPVWRLSPLLSNLYPHMALQTETDECGRLLAGLESNIYQLIAVNEKPEGNSSFFHTLKLSGRIVQTAAPSYLLYLSLSCTPFLKLTASETKSGLVGNGSVQFF